jgi:hypothetical protein
MRDELGQSFEHFMAAMGHAAGGAADMVGPRASATKRSVRPGLLKANRTAAALVIPAAVAARGSMRGGARQAGNAAQAAREGMLWGKAKLTRKEPRVKRWPMMLGGLLFAGAAVGAAGAMLARKRANRNTWEEYGTPRTTTGGTESMMESAKSTVESGKEKVQSLAESARERAADMMGSSSSSMSSTEFGSREDLYGKAGSSPNNLRP